MTLVARSGCFYLLISSSTWLPPSYPDSTFLEAKNLKKVYGKRTVVKDISFSIKKGEIVGLLGPNGAGKTTSFYMVVGLVRPESGNVLLDGQNLTAYAMYKRARKGIGYLPQEASVFRTLTVRQNIASVMEIQGRSKEFIKAKVESLLKDLEIAHVGDQLGQTLSGGERRRVEIARALAIEPTFLLLDEPFAGVDPIAVKDIQSVVLRLKETGLGILITDHNVRETLKITDRSYIMYQGQVLCEGPAEFLINDPKAREIYLGDDFKM